MKYTLLLSSCIIFSSTQCMTHVMPLSQEHGVAPYSNQVPQRKSGSRILSLLDNPIQYLEPKPDIDEYTKKLLCNIIAAQVELARINNEYALHKNTFFENEKNIHAITSLCAYITTKKSDLEGCYDFWSIVGLNKNSIIIQKKLNALPPVPMKNNMFCDDNPTSTTLRYFATKNEANYITQQLNLLTK